MFKQRILIIGASTINLVKFRTKLLLELKAQGHEVTACSGELLESAAGWFADHDIAYDVIEQDARRGTNPLHDLRYYRQLKSVIAKRKPTVVLSVTLKPVIYGTLAAHKLRVSTIGAMITGVGMAFMGDGVRQKLIRAISSALLRRALRHADTLIFQNRDDIELFDQIGAIRGQKVVQTHGSGVDLDRFEAGPIPDGPLLFLLISRLIPEKGVRDFARAAAIVKQQHPEARFQIIGPFEHRGSDITPEEVQRWQDEYSIEHLGYIEDVRPYVLGASVYVLPSYYREGQPRSILEAMAMGRPIITTDSVGCRETIIDGENGLLVLPREPEILAEAMVKFIENPEMIHSMGRASATRAARHYDVNQVNQKVIGALGL